MRLATIRTAAGNRAVRMDGEGGRRDRATRTSARCSATPTGGRAADGAAGPSHASTASTTPRWCRAPRRSSASG